jgi:hypothetical protein
MPRNYDKATGTWLDSYKGSVARADVRNPCALCGWGRTWLSTACQKALSQPGYSACTHGCRTPTNPHRTP